MHRIHDCVDTLKRYYPEADTDLVYRAYIFAAKMHRGQTRLSGEPYLSHPIETAVILANMKMDVVTVATGLLHDVLEDTDTSHEQLQELFGPEVAQLVDGVTKISKIHFASREEYQAENLRKMLLAMAKDIRVLLVKLADRLHNVRTLKYAGEEQQRRVAKETLDIYAPLANRLGLGLIKSELEDQSFMYTEPEIYQQLIDHTNETRAERQQTIEITRREIEQQLQTNAIEATISGRQKHLYSIYRKMKSQGISYKEVMDVIGLRVITNTKGDCYSTLGIIHSTWKHIPHTFDDYITLPKPNMYQSLHTAVIGPFGKPVEIQIRTWEMHHLAEEGIAAHWRYKEGKEQDDEYDKKFFGLRHILEWQQELKDPSEFVEHLKIDLFPDEVYVFTPQGQVKCLPQGATPIDFAYAIHTEVGHQCIGAKINERLVPLRTQLRNGDIVSILTQKNHSPGKDWLNYVVTSKAKAKIKQYFRAKQREEEIQIGKELLERALRRSGAKLAQLQKDDALKRVMAELNLSGEEDLFAAIGAEKYSAKQIVHKIFPEEQLSQEQREELLEARYHEADQEKRIKSGSAIKVKGVDNILTRFGNCCKPLPGDEIVGFITRGRGITVHSADCPNILALGLNDERKIEVEWDSDPDMYYPTELYIVGTVRDSILADIVAAIAKTKTEILNSNSEKAANQIEVRCVINVQGREHLNNVIRAVRNVRSVTEVTQVRTLKNGWRE
ncbi:(P)ppGpp synthetase I/GTP pyrophosphokinase, SpoT/RelA [Candidatus Vecturithrix granuli]|uniref:(P)ppGpp synthetase I/GTP pyrophosphokinase, SpoT/RelA n=1 Tax=Vecturithrix granuli TaxID=1499967 RepID=A0A081C7Z4_VECG1|nr:(P)ppGpp synthetase I/GTP pyrophosphokinase, SpoT/RelA [Candidatus Vecturithrix granuli]